MLTIFLLCRGNILSDVLWDWSFVKCWLCKTKFQALCSSSSMFCSCLTSLCWFSDCTGAKIMVALISAECTVVVTKLSASTLISTIWWMSHITSSICTPWYPIMSDNVHEFKNITQCNVAMSGTNVTADLWDLKLNFSPLFVGTSYLLKYIFILATFSEQHGKRIQFISDRVCRIACRENSSVIVTSASLSRHTWSILL